MLNVRLLAGTMYFIHFINEIRTIELIYVNFGIEKYVNRSLVYLQYRLFPL